MPARHNLIEAIGNVLDLGRSHVRIRLIHQRGVERELTQTRNRRQHAHAIRLRIGQQIQDPRALAGQVLVVDVAVLLAELHAHDVDDLVGQIRGDLLLRAAQDEGGDVGGEAGGHARVAPLDGAAHLLREGVPPGQEPRAGQGQERPQVAQRVFDRRAAHRQAPGRVHVAQRPIRGCAGVLDGLRLVDDDAGQGDSAPLVGLEARQRVRGDHDVAVLHLRRDRRSPARRCFDNAANAQEGRELRGLLSPHAHDRGGGDDEDRPDAGARGAQGSDGGEDLHGLAQAHVVRQNGAEPGAQARRQPGVPVTLIGAQHLRQGRHGRQRTARSLPPQRGESLTPLCRCDDRVGLLLEELVHARRHGRQAQTLAFPARQRPCLLQEGLQRPDARPVQAHPDALHLHVVVPASDGLEGLAHAQAVGADPQAHEQVEPVGLCVLDAQINGHAVVGDLDGAHVVGHVPHEAFHGFALHDGRQELRNPPRGDPRGGRKHRP